MPIIIWFQVFLSNTNNFQKDAKVSLIIVSSHICGAFNKFPDFFVQAFKIVVDSWKFTMLLLYILWDDWPIFMISASNEQLQQVLEEWYAIKLCFKLGKSATEMYGMLQTAFQPSCMNQASVFEWHKRLKEGRESVRDDERCGRSKEVNTLQLIGQRVTVWGYYVEVLREFRKRFCRKRPALFKLGQWHFQEENAPVHDSILLTDYLTKMGIKTLPHCPYSPDLGPCNFWLFPKLSGCHYETIEEMKEAVTKVIDMLIQEDFHGTFEKLLEWYNKCIAAEGDYFEGD